MDDSLPVSESFALKAAGLIYRYTGSEERALAGLDLTIDDGEIFGLLGPNGAGKTTTISILSTILKPEAGKVFIKGHDLERHKKEVCGIIGVVPQELGLYPALTARENLRFFGQIHHLRGTRLNRRIENCLAAVGLQDRAGQRVDTFSGGMKRRLNLAVGFIHNPEILILDEPTVGIDAQSRHLIMEKIVALNKQGTTILYTTHYMEEAQHLCTRVAIMDQGRILTQGSLAQLMTQAPEGVRDLGGFFLHLTGKALRDG